MQKYHSKIHTIEKMNSNYHENNSNHDKDFQSLTSNNNNPIEGWSIIKSEYLCLFPTGMSYQQAKSSSNERTFLENFLSPLVILPLQLLNDGRKIAIIIVYNE